MVRASVRRPAARPERPIRTLPSQDCAGAASPPRADLSPQSSGRAFQDSKFDQSHVPQTLGIEAEVDDSVPILLPSDDDLAYDVISEADSDLAQAVDMAAGKVRTPFWNTRQVRNALAWMLVSVAISLYVVGAVLPFPWGTVLNTLLGLSGVSAIDAYRLAASPKLDDEADSGINDQ